MFVTVTKEQIEKILEQYDHSPGLVQSWRIEVTPDCFIYLVVVLPDREVDHVIE